MKELLSRAAVAAVMVLMTMALTAAATLVRPRAGGVPHSPQTECELLVAYCCSDLNGAFRGSVRRVDPPNVCVPARATGTAMGGSDLRLWGNCFLNLPRGLPVNCLSRMIRPVGFRF